MNRALAAAVEHLRARGVLAEAPAAFLGRLTRNELVSVRRELQVALWAGVTMIAGGAGLLVKEHVEALAPATIASGIGFAAALCLWYVARRAPAFSWGPVTSPTLAFDYILLLAVLLIGTEFAYLETQFEVLGPNWPWHLFLLALIQLAFAFRHDSRAVLALALTSFAAWRGIALSFPGTHAGASGDEIRLNALLVGALYLGIGLILKRGDRKAHFEPTFGNAGLLLLLGAAVTGTLDGDAGRESAWLAALAALAGAAMTFGLRARRADYFALGVIAAFIGFVRIVADLQLEIGRYYLIAAGSFGALFLILWAHRRFREGS